MTNKVESYIDPAVLTGVSMETVLVDSEGRDIKYMSATNEEQVLTLGKACVEALVSNYKDEENLGGEEKLDRYLLAMKIRESKAPVLLAPEEITKLKTLINKHYSSLVVGQTWLLIDPVLRQRKLG